MNQDAIRTFSGHAVGIQPYGEPSISKDFSPSTLPEHARLGHNPDFSGRARRTDLRARTGNASVPICPHDKIDASSIWQPLENIHPRAK
jgi:hypothetical protein